MKGVPSIKIYSFTFLAILIFSTVDFYKKSKSKFFQLNYNWEEKTIIKNYQDIEIDSISYDFLSINISNDFDISTLKRRWTLCVNNKYYFRYTSFNKNNHKLNFVGGFWINDIPKKQNLKSSISLKQVDLKLKEKNDKEHIKICMIGDSQISYREGKNTRKDIYSRIDNVFFVGNTEDVYGFKYVSETLLNSEMILESIEEVPKSDIYILFLGAHEKNVNSFEENIKEIISQLLLNDSNIILINPVVYENDAKKAFSIQMRTLYEDIFANNKKVRVINLKNILEKHSDFFLSDGIHLNKKGHKILSNTLINYIK